MGSDTAAAVAETIAETAGMITDVAAEATIGTQTITQTAVREASAITDTEATWATFETVATEASVTVANVASLETVTDTTSVAADATATVSDASSGIMTAVEEVLVFAGLTAHTVVDSTTTTVDATIDTVTEIFGTTDQVVGKASEITTDTAGTGHDGTSDAVTTISEAASAVIEAVAGDGASADQATVLNETTTTVVSDLDAASLQRIQGGSSPMRDQRFLLSVNRGQTEGERFPGNEPAAACEDASSLNCALTGSADGIDSLVESVASIIRILALTGLTLLPWVAAAGVLASLGGLALAVSRRRRAARSLPEEALPRGSHVKDAWAYS
jgi:hypothetical protein